MFSQLKNNSTVINLQRQYESLPQRDRSALKVMFGVLLLVISYFALWQPAHKYMKEAQSDLAFSEELLALVNNNKTVLSSLSRGNSSNNQKPTLDSQQLVSSVTNMAKKKGVLLKRFEPSGGNKLKVWVDNAEFDKVIVWLTTLKKSLGVQVEQITIEKDDGPGLVSARMTLSS